MTQLDALLNSLSTIRRTVHGQDEGRIFLFEKTARELRGILQTEGLTAKANQQYLLFLTQVDCAQDFFRFIVTDRNETALADFITMSQQVSDSIGVKTSPPKFIEVHVTQMRRAVQNLLQLNILSEELQTELQSLNRLFLEELAVASQGDVRAAVQTRNFYEKIRTLYQPLESVLASKPAYELYLEIVGINEFLGSYTAAVQRGNK